MTETAPLYIRNSADDDWYIVGGPHDIVGDQHTADGNQWDVVGLVGEDLLGLLVSSYNPGANANLLRTDAEGNIILETATIGQIALAAKQISTAIDALTIAPAGDLILAPVGNDVLLASASAISTDNWMSQLVGWGISYAGAGDFRTLYADELHVEAFIADIYEAMIGGIIITKSRGRLSRNFVVPATDDTGTLYLEDLEGWENIQLFETGDIVRLRVVSTTGGGLVVADVWGTVSAYADLSGGEQSYTFTTTDDGGVEGEQVYAGSIGMDYGQAGSGSRGIWEATVLDLAGSPYSQVATWDTNPWTPANWTARVRLGNLDGLAGVGLEYGLYAGQGLTISDAYVLVTDSQVDLHNLPLTIHDGVNTRIKLDPVGPYIGVGSTAPAGYLGADGFWVGNDAGTYKFHLGDVDGEVLLWDGAALKIGVVAAEHIVADGSTLAFMDGATKMAELSGSAWVLGQVGAGLSNVYITSGALHLRNNAVQRVSLSAAGILEVKDSAGAAVFTFNASAGAEFTKPLTIGAAGGIYQGTGTFAAPTTGLKLWNDGGVGRLAGYNAGILQAGFSTSGILEAGGGNVKLDSSGVVVVLDTTFSTARSYRLIDNSGNDVGYFGGLYGTSLDHISIKTPGTVNKDGRIEIHSSGWDDSSQEATVDISAYVGSSRCYIEIHNDPDSENYIKMSPGLRIAGGLYVGSTGTDPDADDIHFDGNLKSMKNSTVYDVYAIHPVTAPFTSTSWDGDDAKTVAASPYEIDTSAVFGVPAGVKAVYIRLATKWAGVDNAYSCNVRAKGGSSGQVVCRSDVSAGGWNEATGWVSCDANGDIEVVVGGADTTAVFLELWHYAI